MRKLELYLMRHGETDMNRAECLQGHIDCELNETGIDEARRAAVILGKAGICFDRVYSSPLKRAVRTAEITAKGCPVIVEPLITEMSFGQYEGTPYRKIDEKMWAFIRDPENVAPPEGVESVQSLTGRTGRFLRRVLSEDSGKVLAVTHGIALRGLLRELYGDNAAGVWGMPIENCVIYKVTAEDGVITEIRQAHELSLNSATDTSAIFGT